MYRLTSWLTAALMLFSIQATAASLSDIQVSNGDRQARITISFIGDPEYSFSPQGKRTVALDIKQSGVLQGLPLQFSGNNLVKSIRSGAPQDTQSLRLLVDLTADGKTRAVKQQNGSNYTVVFTINADEPPPPPPPPPRVVVKQAERPVAQPVRPSEPARNPFKADNDRLTAVTSTTSVTRPAARTVSSDDKVIIAIDAGHGGQDPGAIGPNGTKEKNVTIAIARKLRALLNADPQFKPVLTRDGDYFISVMGRSDVARKQNATFLVSIHADAAPNRDAPVASPELFQERLMEVVQTSPTPVRRIIVTAEPVTSVDVTSADMLRELGQTLSEQGIALHFAEMKDPVRDKLRRFELTEVFDDKRFHPTIDSAVEAYLDSTA